MNEIQFYAVEELPQNCEPDSFYYVKNGELVEAYLTTALGIPLPISNTDVINGIVVQSIIEWFTTNGGKFVRVDQVQNFTEEEKAQGRANLGISNNDGSGDKYYRHDQAEASQVWKILHRLNKRPSVTVTDTAGTVFLGQVTYENNNELTVEFNFPFSGYAELN